jgi:hypothetical protein
MAAWPRAAPPSLRDACVHALALTLHTVPLSVFTSVQWPEECLELLLAVRCATAWLGCQPRL